MKYQALVSWLDHHQYLSLPMVAMMILQARMGDDCIFSVQNVHISMWRHSHFPQVLENDCQIRGKVKEIFPMLLAPGQAGPYLKIWAGSFILVMTSMRQINWQSHHWLLAHRAQRVDIGKNISVSFQSLGGGINPAGQNESSVDDFVSLCTCCE